MENPGDRRRSNFLIDKDPHMVFEDIISLQARLSERDLRHILQLDLAFGLDLVRAEDGVHARRVRATAGIFQ